MGKKNIHEVNDRESFIEYVYDHYNENDNLYYRGLEYVFMSVFKAFDEYCKFRRINPFKTEVETHHIQINGKLSGVTISYRIDDYKKNYEYTIGQKTPTEPILDIIKEMVCKIFTHIEIRDEMNK